MIGLRLDDINFMIKNFLPISFVSLVILISCVSFASSSNAGSPIKNYSVSLKHKWKKKQLNVCWSIDSGNSSSNSEGLNYISNIRDGVTSQFSYEITGISFVGWQPCQGGQSKFDVKMILTIAESDQDEVGAEGSEITGDATIGHDKEENPEVNISYKKRKVGWIKKLSLSDTFKLAGIHEFAHIAGLDHQRDGSDPKNKIIDSDYDKNSVMGYKTMFFLENSGLTFMQNKNFPYVLEDPMNALILNNKENTESVQMSIALSTGDVIALRCLYRYNRSERFKFCDNIVTTIP